MKRIRIGSLVNKNLFFENFFSLDNLFLNDNNINFNIEGLDRKAQIFIDPAKLKEKYLDIKSNERIRLEKKEIHEIKRNLNKLFKEYNFRKLKMKQQNKL